MATSVTANAPVKTGPEELVKGLRLFDANIITLLMTALFYQKDMLHQFYMLHGKKLALFPKKI